MTEKNTSADPRLNPKNQGVICLISNQDDPEPCYINWTEHSPHLVSENFTMPTDKYNPALVRSTWHIRKSFLQITSNLYHRLKSKKDGRNPNLYNISRSSGCTIIEKAISDCYSSNIRGKRHTAQTFRWALFLKYLGVEFQHLTQPIETSYMPGLKPDFFLPRQDCYLFIRNDFFHTPDGYEKAHYLALISGRPVFQFWELGQGVSLAPDMSLRFRTGIYITPEGEFDGGICLGLCQVCGNLHIGHLGSPELSDCKGYSTMNCDCNKYSVSEPRALMDAYKHCDYFLGKQPGRKM